VLGKVLTLRLRDHYSTVGARFPVIRRLCTKVSCHCTLRLRRFWSCRGFAARCEARLCLAVNSRRKIWAVPPVRPLALKTGAQPEPRAQPKLNVRVDGGAEPRRTSGGEAAACNHNW